MIEVEIRGRLTKDGYQQLKDFLTKNGELIESHDREMYLLYDYPGYDADPLVRATDIRLRNTDGKCEIMVKYKASDNNVARKEVSLQLAENNLDAAKELVKAFGCSRGLKMLRRKIIYMYQGVEWSLTTAYKGDKDILYYEAEMALSDDANLSSATEQLNAIAHSLGLSVLSPKEFQDLVIELSREVNEEVEF